MNRILVMCTHNSARSQMGEGWLRKLAHEAGLEAEIWSAGTEKTLVKPPAIQVMGEVGVDLSAHTSKTVDEIPNSDNFDAVITVCDSANDACPYFAGKTRRYHVSLPDPSGHDLQCWRESRDQVGRVMTVFVNELAAGRWPTPESLNEARQSKPCCAKCGADASQFTWASNSQHSMDGFLVYCKQCGAVLTWVPHSSSHP